MTLTVTSQGFGNPRDVALVYHASLPADVMPGALIASDNQPAFKRLYEATNRGGILPLAEALAKIQELAGPFEVRRLFLVGFSEGVQAVRAHLGDGADPSAAVAVDGTHTSSAPATMANQLAMWAPYVQKALDGDRTFIASHSQIVPTGFESTAATLRRITGFPLESSGPVGTCAVSQSGGVIVYSCDGSDEEAHRAQGRVMLPLMAAQAFQLAGTAPVAISGANVPPAAASGVVKVVAGFVGMLVLGAIGMAVGRGRWP